MTQQFEVIFSVSYIADRLVTSDSLVVYDGMYEVIHLDTDLLDEFNGGYCIKPLVGECHIFITKEGNIYAPEPYAQQYI